MVEDVPLDQLVRQHHATAQQQHIDARQRQRSTSPQQQQQHQYQPDVVSATSFTASDLPINNQRYMEAPTTTRQASTTTASSVAPQRWEQQQQQVSTTSTPLPPPRQLSTGGGPPLQSAFPRHRPNFAHLEALLSLRQPAPPLRHSHHPHQQRVSSVVSIVSTITEILQTIHPPLMVTTTVAPPHQATLLSPPYSRRCQLRMLERPRWQLA